MFGIQQQFVDNIDEQSLNENLLYDIDYEAVYNKIDILEKKSIDYIKNSINNRG